MEKCTEILLTNYIYIIHQQVHNLMSNVDYTLLDFIKELEIVLSALKTCI